jgi:NAD(P)H dehydrogenase (quinone)
LVVDHRKAKVRADRIIALVRKPANAANLGVSVREADYDRPELSKLIGRATIPLATTMAEVLERST